MGHRHSKIRGAGQHQRFFWPYTGCPGKKIYDYRTIFRRNIGHFGSIIGRPKKYRTHSFFIQIQDKYRTTSQIIGFLGRRGHPAHNQISSDIQYWPISKCQPCCIVICLILAWHDSNIFTCTQYTPIQVTCNQNVKTS